MSEHLTIEQWLGFNFNPQELVLICIGLPALISMTGLLLVRRLVPSSHLKKHHDISGPIFSALGTVYGVFLTLIITNTWHAYDQTSSNVVQEARCLESLNRNASAFSPEARDQINLMLRKYRDQIVNDEWPCLARGQRSPEVSATLNQIIRAFANLRPPESSRDPFFAQSVKILQEMESLRASRIDDSQSGLLPFLWFVLLAGGALTVGFCFLFGAEDFPTHAVMTLILTTVIALGFLTIIQLDFPFTGAVKISPDYFSSIPL